MLVFQPIHTLGPLCVNKCKVYNTLELDLHMNYILEKNFQKMMLKVITKDTNVRDW